MRSKRIPLPKDARLLRIERGLTQMDLAIRSGVPQTTISGIERGRSLNLDTARRIAAALAVSLDHLRFPAEAPEALAQTRRRGPRKVEQSDSKTAAA